MPLRRRGGVVELAPLGAGQLASARAWAQAGLDVARAHEGLPRAALEEALDAAVAPADDATAADRRLALGCKRLLLDACDFATPDAEGAEALRATLFNAAAQARAQGRFVREQVIAAVAAERGLGVDDVERLLFADLAEAHPVAALDVRDADELLRRWQVGRIQAVLLRATRLQVTVDATPAQLRALLRAAKLRQLLFDVDMVEGGVRLRIEGPLALFSSVTRYGLKLALLVPAIRACRRWHIEAEVKLRKDRTIETFVAAGNDGDEPAPDVELHPIAAKLNDDVARARGPFTAAPASDVLRLPGAGALVPDLVLTHGSTGEQVFVEILGFWSRSAVWRRVELVERGLPFKVVFCVSERLRVSEEALPDAATGALVVFKGALSAARVVERALRLTAG
ncbi:MAG: hypothetical protein A2138_19540 [Deltaproteobacteria bacterium RBG_16_71_12]|nr:MAG: hypothetical protein A2138_19540 [Deltaproteobacteria bacterium RBG_16_71_12]